MTEIAPTVTAENSHIYRSQIEVIERIAQRAHVDFSDGVFSPVKMLPPTQAWKPKVRTDFHLMFQDALLEKETIVALSPDLVILHCESDNFEKALDYYKRFQFKVGIAFLPDSRPSDYAEALGLSDHALVFAGSLGYQGGAADLKQLEKVDQLKSINPNLEIGWDGGINADNAAVLAEGGVDVLNIGGFIQKSDNPDNAYDIIKQKLEP